MSTVDLREQVAGHSMTPRTCHLCTWQGPLLPTIAAAWWEFHRALHVPIITMGERLLGPILRRLTHGARGPGRGEGGDGTDL